jgi:glutamyl-tRNA synthetase
MRITHVIRGEDHLSNTSKHIELFKAFGVPVPVYAHIPLILKQSGPGKMSKRDKGALVEEYRARGYLPEALVNFLCLLGWNPGDEREKMPIDEIVRLFDLPGVNQSNARFDEKKLAHMNMLYLLALSADRFVALARDYLERRLASLRAPAAADAPAGDAQRKAESERELEACALAIAADPGYFREVVLLSQPKIKGFEELPGYTRYFFDENFPVDPNVRAKIMGKGGSEARLTELAGALKAADFSSDGAIEEAIKALAVKNGLGFGDYQPAARLAVSGTNVGPSLTGIFRLLGRERVLGRIERFLNAAA